MKKLSTVKNSLLKFPWYSDRSINAFKTLIACLIGVLLINNLKLPMGQWVVMTILVVMCGSQTNLGGTLLKAKMRLLGTLIGASVAALTLLITGGHSVTSQIVFLCTALVFSYVAGSPAAYSDVGKLGAVTTALILLGHDADLTTAAYRSFEITTGILIALLVSRFVFPIRAEHRLQQAMANHLQQLGELLKCYTSSDSEVELQITELEQRIIDSITQQRRLLREANVERKHQPTFKPDYYQHFINDERTLFRLMLLLQQALQEEPQDATLLVQRSEFLSLRLILIDLIQHFATAMAAKDSQAMPEISAQMIQDYQQKITLFLEMIKTFPNRIHMDTIIFIFKQLYVKLQAMIVAATEHYKS